MSKTHLYDVDDVIRQPEYCKGTDDHQDEAAAFCSALELGTLQTTDDGGVTGADEGERQQEAHDGFKQVLEDPMTLALPVVRHAEAQSDIVWESLLQITYREKEEKHTNITSMLK